jgi:hypothetical protein
VIPVFALRCSEADRRAGRASGRSLVAAGLSGPVSDCIARSRPAGLSCPSAASKPPQA